MNDTEEILTRLAINNPTDASLVRLAGLASSMPTADAGTLVGRVTFTHPRDKQLATALVESIRANAPKLDSTIQPPARRSLFLVGVFAALAIGAGVLAIHLSTVITEERQMRAKEIEQFGQKVTALQTSSNGTIADLKSVSTNAEKSSAAMSKTAEEFTKTLSDYLQRLNQLTAENDRLKAELVTAKAAALPSSKP